MTLKLYNTLSRKKEVFKPIKGKEAGMYSCGPTVYDYAHIGNFRAYVCNDVLKRYLKYKGFKVKHVMNLTDVDDKTIKGARQEKISLKDYTTKYEKAFFEDIRSLNVDEADVFPRATDNIKEMAAIVKKLMEKGVAYKTEDGIYYDITKFREYGKLSRTKLENLEAGKRVRQDQYEKEEAQDFALWKFWDKEDGDVYWETEIGKGRPGWHLECSAMSMKYLGNHFDIHSGGIDLVFPHHENEIAQSEGSTGKSFVNYWFHNEHLLVEGKKMSKSLGNFFTLRDLLEKGYDPTAIRYTLMSAHYRQQLNFTEEGIKASENSIERLQDLMLKLKSVKKGDSNKEVQKLVEETRKKFEEEMDDDLNISNALAVLFDFVKKANTSLRDDKVGKKDAEKCINLVESFDKVLGVIETKKEEIPEEVQKLVDEREKIRKEKNFEKADKLRDKIKQKGYAVEDTKEGPLVKRL